MSAIKHPGEPDDGADPFYQYLERTYGRGSKLERLDALLRQLNLQAASGLDFVQTPTKRERSDSVGMTIDNAQPD